MRFSPLGRTAALAATALLIAACGGGGPAASEPGNGGGDGGGTPTQAAYATPGGSADAGSLNPCGFLNATDVQSVLGFAVKPGEVKAGDGQTSCTWNAQAADGGSLVLTVQNYDDATWQGASSAAGAAAVSGIGDAAFKGWPQAGTLSVKAKSYILSVAVTDPKATPDKIDAENLSIAQLSLPRL